VVYNARPRDAERTRNSGFGAFIAIVVIVGVAVFGYHTYRDSDDAANRSTIEAPVTSPQDPSASSVHPSPSPNPGP
jgi:hypothetical protein